MDMKRTFAIWIMIVAVLNPATILAQVAAVPAVAAAPIVSAASASGAIVEPAPSAVHLVAGRSTVLDVGAPIARVSLTSADVADALVTSATQLLVHGKLPGTISMFVWERSGTVRRYEVIVARDIERLAAQIRQLFPTESIQVGSNGRDVVLSGAVSTKEVGEQAINLSAGFVDKKEEVVSLLRVQARPSNQVLLRVRFAEVSRAALTELGVSLFTGPTGINNTLGRVTTQQFGGNGFDQLKWTKADESFGSDVTSAEGKVTFSDFLNLFILSEKYDLGALIRALSSKGLFQSLAEPNLVAESGKEASFLAGGEFPIPVSQPGGGNAITVQFKEFGVRLSFTPVVNGNRVHLKVRPEVSTLDFANGIHLDGFRIPALISRRTETELELADGQTFAIAGLLNNTLNSTMQKIPGIGDIPILGYLFRSKAAQKNRTELVVMITPHILPEGSPGVTPNLLPIEEPFLSPPPQDRLLAPPPPAFPQSGRTSGTALVASEASLPAPAGPASSVVAAAAPRASSTTTLTPQPVAVVTPQPAAVPQPTAAERRAAERERKAEAERAGAALRAQKAQAAIDARAQQAAAEAEEKRLKAERERQQKLSVEQKKRDAEAARLRAEADRREAEEARRKAEAEKRRQAAVDAAAAKMRAAEAAYQAEVARNQAR
jgi:pilus assembly protein CpaC